MSSNMVEGHAKSSKRVKRTQKMPRRRSAPVVTITPRTDIWSTALELANGNVKRLVTQSDGSVIVYNNPVR